jgi:Rieske Fe-S protein
MRRGKRRRPDRLLDAVADGRALPPGRIDDPEDVEALRAAIELRAGVPAADLPSEEFVAGLRSRLAAASARDDAVVVTRRSMLASAGSIAAGAVAAGAVGVVVDRTLLQPGTTPLPAAGPLDPADGEWTVVAADTEMADRAPRRFDASGVIGYVSVTDAGTVAVSAACTHQGCILQHNAEARRLDCPCHRTAFSVEGDLLFSQLPTPPRPLTRLQVRRRDGSIEVLLPRTV